MKRRLYLWSAGMELSCVDDKLPVLLNQGLDESTPALMVKPGSMIDCLNYEMTGDIGYKRIDGYERFDGYPNGSLNTFYMATIVAANPADQSSLTVGTVLARPVTLPAGAIPVGGNITDEVGTIVSSRGNNQYVYAAYDANGSLRANETIYFTYNDVQYTATVTVSAQNFREVETDPVTYLNSHRTFTAAMRGQVLSTSSSIAGVWTYGTHTYIAVDAMEMYYILDNAADPLVQPGALLRYNGTKYRVLSRIAFKNNDTPVPGSGKISVMPVGTSPTVNSTLVEITSSDTVARTLSTNVNNYVEQGSEWAYVARCNDPVDSTSRGFTPLSPTVRLAFDAGTYSSENLPLTGWTLRNSTGSASMVVRIADYTISSGTFAAGTATGYVYVTGFGSEAGGTSSVADNWELHYSGVRRMTVNAPAGGTGVLGTNISGTGRLVVNNTRYQTVVANFYGNQSLRKVYGTTGSSRAFWADYDSFGTIVTLSDEKLDQPKYVAVHALRLCLGYAVGSVLRSVAGEPLSWEGVLGAQEIATGDQITGLLEAQGDSVIVFGRSSIRRIDSSGVLSTISSNSGAFDYTAVMMGSQIMYTGIHGISTLEQTAAYGDFAGNRASSIIQQWLRPRLLVDNNGFETGGVAMALECRNKNQYRLFLKNGTVIFLTQTGEGYKATRVNYGLGNDLRVPLAWSSSVADNGKERIHVVWDHTLAARGIRGVVGTLPSKTTIYELDSGWGFDGKTFKHFFDVAHILPTTGTSSATIERVRMFGRGYGVGSLKLRASGIDEDFEVPFSAAPINFSLPRKAVGIKEQLSDYTVVTDHANWGIGVKLRVEGSVAENQSMLEEPSHICQVLVLHIRGNGAEDA